MLRTFWKVGVVRRCATALGGGEAERSGKPPRPGLIKFGEEQGYGDLEDTRSGGME